MRVFVAGATGAVGRRMIPQLISAGHSVIAISRQSEKVDQLGKAGVKAFVCDVFDRHRLAALVRETTPDAIIQQLTDLPATMNPRRLAEIYERNNRVRREGTSNLIAAARRANVKRMIVQSMATWYRPTDSAIGGTGSRWKVETESLWTDAPEPIGTAVRTVEEMENTVMREMPIGVILRYGALYGPGTWYAPDGEITQRIRRRALPVVGSGSGVTSFIHVDDAASAAVVALTAPSSGIYNIVDDEPAAASVWMPLYASSLGAEPPRKVPTLLARLVIGKALTEWITTMRGASNQAAAARLGWKPRYRSWRAEFGKKAATGGKVAR